MTALSISAASILTALVIALLIDLFVGAYRARHRLIRERKRGRTHA